MKLHELARDGESQPRPVMRARGGSVDLGELAEHQLVMIPGNAARTRTKTSV